MCDGIGGFFSKKDCARTLGDGDFGFVREPAGSVHHIEKVGIEFLAAHDDHMLDIAVGEPERGGAQGGGPAGGVAHLGVNGAADFQLGDDMAEWSVDDSFGEKNGAGEAASIGGEAFVEAHRIDEAADEKRSDKANSCGVDIRPGLEGLRDGFDEMVRERAGAAEAGSHFPSIERSC